MRIWFAALAAIGLSFQSAHAQSLGSCATLSQGSTYDNTTVALSVGDILYFPNDLSPVMQGQAPPFWGVTNVSTTHTDSGLRERHFRVTVAGTYTVRAVNGFSPALILCTPAHAVESITHVQSLRSASAASLGSALSLAGGLRHGDTGFAASRNGLFWNTQDDENAQVNLWSLLEFRHLSGTNSGDALSFHIGADVEMGPNAYVGLVASRSHMTTTATSGENITRQTALGPYFGFHSPRAEFNGYVAFARPEHSIGGTNFQSKLTSFGLRVASKHNYNSFQMQPFLALRGSREDVPTYTVGGSTITAQSHRDTNLQIGLRAERQDTAATQLRPYGSIAIEFGRSDTSLLSSQSYTAPRVMFGVKTGANGSISSNIEIELGRSDASTLDTTLRGNVQFAF
ncbi:MAG: hypothetical protein JXR13_04670 [Thalassovita sp.]